VAALARHAPAVAKRNQRRDTEPGAWPDHDLGVFDVQPPAADLQRVVTVEVWDVPSDRVEVVDDL